LNALPVVPVAAVEFAVNSSPTAGVPTAPILAQLVSPTTEILYRVPSTACTTPLATAPIVSAVVGYLAAVRVVRRLRIKLFVAVVPSVIVATGTELLRH
jgi:hypothetical protein